MWHTNTSRYLLLHTICTSLCVCRYSICIIYICVCMCVCGNDIVEIYVHFKLLRCAHTWKPWQHKTYHAHMYTVVMNQPTDTTKHTPEYMNYTLFSYYICCTPKNAVMSARSLTVIFNLLLMSLFCIHALTHILTRAHTFRKQ